MYHLPFSFVSSQADAGHPGVSTETIWFVPETMDAQPWSKSAPRQSAAEHAMLSFTETSSMSRSRHDC